MNKFAAHSIIITLLTVVSLGAISINQSGGTSVNYRRSAASDLLFEISLEDIQINTITFHGVDYTYLSIDGYSNHHSVGAPGLPVVRKIINVPQNSNIEYEISLHSIEFIDLAQQNYPELLLPVQPFRQKNDKQQPLVKDAAIYATDEFYTLGPVKIHPAFSMGGVSGVMLDYFPIAYNPVRHSLRIISSATITVKISDDPNLQKKNATVPIITPEIDRMAREIFVNYDENAGTVSSTLPEKFMVIVGDQFAGNVDLATYLSWKRQCGFDIILKTVSELGGTTTLIKDYITEQYNSSTPPSYVLLVGDIADIPAWTGSVGESESDAPYSRMDDDYIPDLMIGRFSATDAAELNSIIQKSLAYEQCAFEKLDAFSKITFISTNDVDYWELAEASHNYIITAYLNSRGIYADHIKGHSGGSATDIFHALNDGRTICHYSGHGLEYEWQGPQFTMSNIGQLTAGQISSFIISNACLTGSFAQAECFGESWIRADDKGAFAFIGASNSSYWEPDDIMERGMYKGLFIDGKSSVAAILQSGLFNVYNQTYSPDDTWTYRYYYDVYNLLGDPSIKPWIGVPRKTYAEYSSTLFLSSDQFSVSVLNETGPVSGARVTLVQGQRLIAVGTTDVNGNITLYFENDLLEIGDLILTVTADEQIPLVDVLKIVNPVYTTMEPDTIPIGIVSDISINVLDDSSNALGNIEIHASGWTVHGDSILGITDPSGYLQFQLNPRYGEIIAVYGKAIDGTGYSFIDTLRVSGEAALTNPDISVAVRQFNIDGFLVPGYSGEVSGSVDDIDTYLALRGCGIDTAAALSSLTVIPDTIGTLKAALLKPGFGVFETLITVKKATGTALLNVTDTENTALEHVFISVFLYPDTLNPVFRGETDGNGMFDYLIPLTTGYYQIRAQLFGFQSLSFIDTIRIGENIFNLKMPESPQFSVSGRVTGGIFERPLSAQISIDEFSSGTAKNYINIETDSNSGGAYQLELPSGDYVFNVSSVRYVPETVSVTIADQPLEVDFNLDTTKASILLVDDDSGKRARDKTSLHAICIKEIKGGSATDIQELLETLGYYVQKSAYTTELNDVVFNFDMLISSSGSNISPLENSDYRTMLESFTSNGGVLLIEGGEVGYDATTDPGYPNFARNVLHVSEWKMDDAGPLYRLMSDNELTTTPNVLPFQIDIDYDGFGDEDACIPTSDADILYYNDNNSSEAGIIFCENPDISIGGKTVFYTFAFDKIDDFDIRAKLLENTVTYLLKKPEYSKGDINKDLEINILDLTKIVNLILEIDSPDDDEFWAADLNSDNAIDVLDLVGVINIILGRNGLGKPVNPEGSSVRLSQLQQNLVIDASIPLAAVQIHLKPGSMLDIDTEFLPDDINIRQNKNTWLIYSLEDDGIHCESLELGRLDPPNAVLSAVAVDVNGNLLKTELSLIPDKYQLYQNYPNPFNAATVIRFDLPHESHITLEIYDLQGRRVMTLADGIRQPGSYHVRWNGRDLQGRELATGIYFYSIRADNFRQLRKMALVK